MTVKPVQPISDKKPYQSPQLLVYGNISQITQNSVVNPKTVDSNPNKIT